VTVRLRLCTVPVTGIETDLSRLPEPRYTLTIPDCRFLNRYGFGDSFSLRFFIKSKFALDHVFDREVCLQRCCRSSKFGQLQ
jgi:hypothetical protein